MAKTKRLAVYWNCSDPTNQLCWYVDANSGTTVGVIEDILKNNCYGCLDYSEKQEFIKDALNGKVLIVEGTNKKYESFEENKTYTYGREMHSVNNYKSSVKTKVPGVDNWEYGFKFVFEKSTKLKEEELEVIKTASKHIEKNIKIDKVFEFFCLLLITKAKRFSLPIFYSTADKGQYGRTRQNIEFNTLWTHTYESSKNLIDTIDRTIEEIYKVTKELYGCGLMYDYKEFDDEVGPLNEAPEILLSSRRLYNEALINSGDLNQVTNEERIKYLLEHKIIDKININNDHENCRLWYCLQDDTTLIVENKHYSCTNEPNVIDFSESNMDDVSNFADLPDCLVVSDYNNIVDHLILYGDSKVLYEALGGKEFLNIVKHTNKN